MAKCMILLPYRAISRRAVGKSVHATIPKDIMGCDQYTVPDTVAVEPCLVTFLFGASKHMSIMASRAILSNSFEEQ